jgi:D-glycero-D-manno-heptose 1,7-bisphosphate phosphatase
MIHQAEADWGIDVRRSYLVGDRSSDIVAGRAAGLYTIFLDRGYAEPLLERPDARVRSLRQAVRKILARDASMEATHGAFETSRVLTEGEVTAAAALESARRPP